MSVDRSERIYSAFAEAVRPTPDGITRHECGECDQVRDLLSPFEAREVPDVEVYPLYSALPLLTAEAYRYYLPRYVAEALSNSNSLAGEMLIYSLGQDFDARVSEFSTQERAAILEFVDYFETLATTEDDLHYIEAARKLWK